MSACPQCGTLTAANARACTACGRPLIAAPGRGGAQRTLLGGLDATVLSPPPAAGAQAPQRTLLGVARPFGEGAGQPQPQPTAPGPGLPGGASHPFGGTQRIDAPAGAPAPAPLAAQRRVDPWTDPVHALPTIVDARPLGAYANGQAPAPQHGAEATQQGRAPMVREQPAEARAPLGAAPPLEELGATQGPARGRMVPLARPSDPAHPLERRRIERARNGVALPEAGRVQVKKNGERSGRQGLWLALGALGLVAVAVVVALVWPSAPPLEARVRAADDASEVVDLSCASCPDGTVLRLRDTEAIVRGGQATLPLGAPLTVGDTPVRIAIDRPGGGRDETVQIPLRVAYRIRPDLSSLQADRPTLQVVVETSDEARVVLDGETIPVRGGRAIKSIDVSAELGGSADLLSRKIAYEVTPPDGEEERGVVAVAVSILPLSIDSPGRAVVTDQTSFLLAGRTAPGAEVVVAGRAIHVASDGSFSQHMNVSSVGTTQIEVRTKAQGKAPRIAKIAVQRVASLEQAAKEFVSRSPITLDAALADPEAARARPIAIEGEVLEVRTRPHQTTLVVRARPPSCSGEASRCVVRLVQGGAVDAPRGSMLRAYGAVAGTVQHEGKAVLDVDVAFSLPGQAGAPRVAPRERSLLFEGVE